VSAKAALIQALRMALASHADAQQAGPMQAYMKSVLPFRGVKTPLRRKLMVEAVKSHACTSTRELADTMLALWRDAAFREERYAAMELARVGSHRKLLDMSLFAVYEQMIVEGAWWDICDDISSEAIGWLLQRHPLQMKPLLRRWAQSNNLWLRRASILCQRRLKDDFDAHLFYACILPSLGASPWAGEFFIRKGIGWALRERSYQSPQEVQAFCREYQEQLSPLTRREALRVIAKRAASG
jgi:3-methyladenine DNA glycosylase AlkD